MSNSWLNHVSLASLLAGENGDWQVLAQEARKWEVGSKRDRRDSGGSCQQGDFIG